MSSTYTTRLKLEKQAQGDAGWDAVVRANYDALDGCNALGDFAVAPAEVPSASLDVKVAGGTWQADGGQPTAYAGSASVAVTASATSYLYLDHSGTLVVGAGWPSAPHVRLATVVAGAGTIASIADARVFGVLSTAGYRYIGTPAAAPADANLVAGSIAFFLDESGNNLKVRVRKSNGTYLTGAVALA